MGEAHPDREAAVAGIGPHLVFDGYQCPLANLEDLDRLRVLLEDLPQRIRQPRVSPAYVVRHGERGTTGSGVSGLVQLADSWISFHTFPSRRFVIADVFSCDPFDVEDALGALRAGFAPRRAAWKLVDRGAGFRGRPERSHEWVTRERDALTRQLGLEASR